VGAVLLILLLCCGAPLVATVAHASADWAATWQVWQHEDTIAALQNTLQFSAAALLGATLLGMLHGFAAHHAQQLNDKNESCYRNINKSWMPFLYKIFSACLSASTWLPFIASPVVVAFGLLLVYPEASGTWGVLIAAYTLLAYPFVTHSVMQGLSSLPAHWFYAAHSLGAGPVRVWWRITMPLLRPALRRGMAFAAATALGEFAVSLFLSRPEWMTLTTLIYQHLGRPGASNLQAAHALSLLLMLLALGVFLLLDARSAPSSSSTSRS
jgi:thiamine transport system permease protein